MGTLLIGHIAMDHTVMAVRFIGLMAMVGFIPIITAGGFRRQLRHLHRRPLSLRDSKKAGNDSDAIIARRQFEVVR